MTTNEKQVIINSNIYGKSFDIVINLDPELYYIKFGSYLIAKFIEQQSIDSDLSQLAFSDIVTLCTAIEQGNLYIVSKKLLTKTSYLLEGLPADFLLYSTPIEAFVRRVGKIKSKKQVKFSE
ncbi:MAG: hypothetical protein WCI47_03600 [bacterium]